MINSDDYHAIGGILIVDDERPSLRVLSDMLIAEGYEVRGATDGSTALMIVENEPPELILLDIQMPDVDGYEVCRQLKEKEKYRDIPVLFLSALSEATDKIKGFEAGAVDFITKPFQAEEVLARVETHLKMSRLFRNLEQQVEKRAVELRGSEKRYRAFMDNNPAVAYIKDETGRHIYCNQTLLKKFDISQEEFVRTTAYDFFSKDTAERLEAYDKIVRTEKTSVEVPIWNDERHGAVRWWKEIKFPISSSSGKTFVGGITLEITDLKRTEEALKESEERYRLLVEAAPVSIMAFRKGCILFANPASARMLGFSDPDKMVGTPAIDIVAPESQQLVTERIKRLESGKNNPTAEIALIRQDGIRITVESNSASILIGGLPTAVIITRDVTERKELEMKLQESEERFRAFMDNIPASVYIKDENDRHIYPLFREAFR